MRLFVRTARWMNAVLMAWLLIPVAGALPDENAARAQLPLLSSWRFHRGALPSGEAVGLDDHDWVTVDLPHTWNAQDGQDGGGDYFRGDGWYRRTVRPDASWQGRRVFLQFDGANRTAEVFLNGRRIGEHRGGTARFRFDVTDAIQCGRDNLLAVRVNNSPRDGIVPVSADFTFFGGLYRAVSLVATDPVHIDLLDYASPGVYARPVGVSRSGAKLDVEVKLANDTAQPQRVAVEVMLLDAQGNLVQSQTHQVEISAHGRASVLRRLVLSNPHLWDGLADPYLHRLRATVLVDHQVRDTVTLPVGLRFFSVDPRRGFLLNGHPLDLHGVNRHQDRWNKGWALTEADEREDFALIREIGATAIRESHYQQSQLWQTLGDEQGMVFWAELGFVNEAIDHPDFFANAKEQLRELIRQNYHHPAICFWSIGNETAVRDKAIASDTSNRLLAELAAVARKEDDSRLSTYASDGDVTEPRAAIPDVIAFNHYFGWYRGTLADFAPWLDRQHELRPDLCLGMSEYGAGANPGQHEDSVRQPVPGGPWHPEEWQAAFHEAYWRALAARPWVWGKFVWCMFDFASDGRNEGGVPGRNDKGLVSADRRVRKDAFYWYQANWSASPMVHITGRRHTPRRESVATVKVYANAPAVELVVNGTSLGVRTSAERIFLWNDVKLITGRNSLRATAGTGATAVSDECTWDVQPELPVAGGEKKPASSTSP